MLRTQMAVASLRDLLEPARWKMTEVGRRRMEATRAAAAVEVVDIGDTLTWYEDALGELRATLRQGRRIRLAANRIR